MIGENNQIALGEPGTRSEEITLTLDADELLDHQDYLLEIPPRQLTTEECQNRIEEAKEEILETFFQEGENADHVTQEVYPKDSYAQGLVTAEWLFENYHYLDADGKVMDDKLGMDGEIVYVEADLCCGEEEELYGFPIYLYPTEKSPQERLLANISTEIASQEQQAGNKTLTLPDEVDGIALQWKPKRENSWLTLVIIEVGMLLLIPIGRRQKKQKEKEKRERRLLLDYPEFVSKLTILVGCGMPIKQCWNRISARDTDKGSKNAEEESVLYKELQSTVREMEEGESERNAYQNFARRIGLRPYYRLVRILIQNLEKGSKGLCEQLERESEEAFEERTMLARKLGEEASTKMIFPLIVMMGVVMVIVIAPAIMEFSI